MMKAEIHGTSQKLQNFLQNFPWLASLNVAVEYDFPEVVVDKKHIHSLLESLKDNEAMGFTFLTTLCGIHFPEKTGQEFWVMYQLHNLLTNERIRLYTHTCAGDLNFDSVTDIWPAANWMEREAFDFYGLNFEGHSNLARILNVEDMDYHPMRKEYRLEDDTRTD
ncbi:MAG TPA: NADH-quinone oxidoreductase subunit C, partial [Saprospiraceae bacterium]|nr:NADH-quinone oxidoreductase subunit C [Saprospiraceae bacterium]